jgi:hypothetical protein
MSVALADVDSTQRPSLPGENVQMSPTLAHAAGGAGALGPAAPCAVTRGALVNPLRAPTNQSGAARTSPTSIGADDVAAQACKRDVAASGRPT